MCVNLPNKLVIFIFLHKFCEEIHCFLEKFTQLEKFYTTAGRDGRDKFQVCVLLEKIPRESLMSIVIFSLSYRIEMIVKAV